MMNRRWWAALALVLISLCGMTGLAQADTIITVEGNVIQGTIEFGIPQAISIETESGDIFTVQKGNIKVIRFEHGEREGWGTVETFDGNILTGKIGGIPDVLGIRTGSGDVLSVKKSSISEIRFAQAGVTIQPAPEPGQPQPPGDVLQALQGVIDRYKERQSGFTLGLDLIVAGQMTRNGFGYPVGTLGVTATLGVAWRGYTVPPVSKVSEAAQAVLSADPSLQGDDLVEAVKGELKKTSFFYFQLGTDVLFFPSAGVGMVFMLGETAFFDVGVLYNPLLSFFLPWLGVMILF